MLVVLAGFFLVRFGLVTRKSSKRITLLASVLMAAGGLWLTEDSKIALKQTLLDSVAFFVVLGLACFSLFWVGVVAGLKIFGDRYEPEFGESSILSMQYLDSNFQLSHDDSAWEFHPAEVSRLQSSVASDLVRPNETAGSQKNGHEQ